MFAELGMGTGSRKKATSGVLGYARLAISKWVSNHGSDGCCQIRGSQLARRAHMPFTETETEEQQDRIERDRESKKTPEAGGQVFL